MPDAAEKKTDEILARMERKLNRVYRQAAKETRQKYLDYTKKFEADDAIQRKKLAAGEITDEQYKNWRERKMFTGKRYQEMANTLAQDLAMVDQKAMSIVNGFLPEAYAVNYNFMAYELGKAGVPLGASFTLYDRHTVEKLMRERKLLLPKPRVEIPKDERWNATHIKNAITQGILQGESIPHIADRLQKVVGMDRAAAIRNGRTAMTGAQNGGRVDRMKDANKRGLNVMQEWCATHDARARDSHLALDGHRIRPGMTFPNGCRYPGDPQGEPSEVYNCRCTLLPYLPDYDFEANGIDEPGDEVAFEKWQKEQISDELKRINDAIANAQEYSPRQHKEMNFKENAFNALPYDERDGIISYTGSHYRRMNDALRKGDKALNGAMIEDLIDNCEKGLSHFSMAEDTKLYRGMGSGRTLARALGITEDEAMEAVRSKSIVGQRFVEKGFCSTGVNSGAGWDKEVVLEIVAPKGTTGMYVDPISRHRGEEEFLIQRGAIFEVREASQDVSEYGDLITKLKVVVVGFEE